MSKCPVCKYTVQENDSQCPHCEFKGVLKWAMIKGATAYIQSIPHHQIELDIISNLKADDTLYLRERIIGGEWVWELHANCPDYMESLYLQLELHNDCNKAQRLVKLWEICKNFRLLQHRPASLYSAFAVYASNHLGVVAPHTEIPAKEAVELILSTYIKEFLL